MKSRLIAAVTAAAVALGSVVASPVAAKDRDNDTLKIILGAAALGLIVNELNKNNGGARPAPQYWGPGQQYLPVQRYEPIRRYPYQQPVRARSRSIPDECLYQVRTSSGPRDVVSGRCMREMGLAGGLPQQCAFDIRTASGTRTVYGPRCMSDYGWRVSSYNRY